MELIEKLISESHRDEFSATSGRPSISPSPLRLPSEHFADVILAGNDNGEIYHTAFFATVKVGNLRNPSFQRKRVSRICPPEHTKPQSYTQSTFLLSASSRDPKTGLRACLTEESISERRREVSKEILVSPTISNSNTIRTWPLTPSTDFGIMFATICSLIKKKISVLFIPKHDQELSESHVSGKGYANWSRYSDDVRLHTS
ncbi:hypothetical protein TNCV_1660421 [Trichonephila clavipes]|nr:hypothetical protein TNCV_1660421 [Trichonephila clavipes]